MIPLMGLLSDRIGRQKMYTLSVVLLGLFIVPWFLLLDTRSTWGIALATVIAFGILWAPVTAVLGTLCSGSSALTFATSASPLATSLAPRSPGVPLR